MAVGLSGCTVALSHIMYSSSKSSVPDVRAQLSDDEAFIDWRFNSREDSELEISEQSWVQLHQGSKNDWTWEILGTEGFSLSEDESIVWDNLLSRLTQHSKEILPETAATNLIIYIAPQPKKHVQIEFPNDTGIIHIPYVLWSNPATGSHLPELFGESSDVMGDIGSNVQLGYYESGLVPHPSESSAYELKKYANSSCWRLAVRPALALGTTNKVKSPPPGYGSLLNIFENMYTSNKDEAEAVLVYASGLLISSADEHMSLLDLNWPQSGRDEAEINALLDFCKSYLKSDRDPR